MRFSSPPIHVAGEELAKRGGLDVQAVNGGVNGYGTESALALLREIARRNALPRLSMGMSADFETAIRFGATHVRVGTAIFGPRARPAA